jgi:hypothetical protein
MPSNSWRGMMRAMASIAVAAGEYRADKPRARWPVVVQSIALVFFAILAGLLWQVVLSGMTERYCYLWPAIGTRFSPNYTERGFNAIKPGMTEQEVQALIGQPLTTGDGTAPPGHALAQPGDLVWTYSSDSSERGGDWAWLSREVVFRSGKVAHTVSWIYYD